MEPLFFPLIKKLWPELEGMSGQKKLVGAGEVFAFLYSLPLSLAGVLWLISMTDWPLLRSNWPLFLFFIALMFLFGKLSFFIITEIRAGRYATSDGSLEIVMLWTAVFLFGPTALWIGVLKNLVQFSWNWRKITSLTARWTTARNFTISIAVVTLASIAALHVYQRSGGTYPLPGLQPSNIATAMGAIVVYFFLQLLVWSGYIIYAVWTQKKLASSSPVRPIIRFLLLALGLQNLSLPFAILAAGLYSQHGLITFLFLVAGMILVANLARQLSWTAESSRQQSRQLEKLETLGRAIINSPPDASTLPDLLEEHVPAMFPAGRILIWVQTGRFFLKHPQDWILNPTPLWEWIQNQGAGRAFQAHERLPWENEEHNHYAMVVAPILGVENATPIGFISLEVFSLVQAWDRRSLEDLFPAVHSLAAQVASALHSAEVYIYTLEYQKITQELALAGKIQASFLPNELPNLTGWELAVTLLPVRDTSGDFFDLIPLSQDRLGILIADVTDKGVGAALYMALSRTLIRTYAFEYDEEQPQPELVLFSANNRILKDARADLFVTAFYGILDPSNGLLTYCNAGQNPPYLLSPGRDGGIRSLASTGMPIGIEEDNLWSAATIQICPGDVLLLYTDGIPDAQNSSGVFYEEKLLVEVALQNLDKPAQEIQDAILRGVNDFVGDSAQFDDITLIILLRNQDEGGSEPDSIIPSS